jgi:aspartyl-tRNA(Asn)/glutamyl-tRNA(Gln) amidotransferase subunit C
MVQEHTLSNSEVEHLAKLARLDLAPAEVSHYAKQLGEVLGYVDKLKELSPERGTVEAEAGVVLRADQVEPWPTPQALVEQAPTHQGTLVEVPAVFDRD